MQKKNNKLLEIHMWGWYFQKKAIPVDLREILINNGGFPEHEVVPKLAKCDFVYAMYPMEQRMRIFSKTSMPTKLSTYIQVGRPIFGHGPSDSSLADFLSSTNTGRLWDTNNLNHGFSVISELLSLSIDANQWQYAREKYYGEQNVEAMRLALTNV